MKMSANQEFFLTEFFTIRSALGESIESRALFFKLADIFCLSEEKLEQLFENTESEVVRDIVTENDFNQFRRIREFTKLTETSIVWSKSESDMISLKGNAILEVTRLGLAATEDMTQLDIMNRLMATAGKGNLLALRILGFLQCEGTFVKSNLRAGRKNLNRAVMWGNIPATLYLLRFSEAERNETLCALNAAVYNTPYDFLPALVAEKYGIPECDVRNENILLLRHMIEKGNVKAELYDPSVARILLSPIISFKDKQNVLLSVNKAAVSDASDLPVNLSYREVGVKKEDFYTMPIRREDEIAKLVQGLNNSDLREKDCFRPLCLCSDSEYVMQTYLSALQRAIGSATFQFVEVGELNNGDFEPTKNGVFLRGLDEKKQNICVLFFRGSIASAAIEQCEKMLRSDLRRSFRLMNPAITLDLSSVVPICFCDKSNKRILGNAVNVVDLAPIDKEEKDQIVAEMFERKCAEFNLSHISAADDVLEKLFALSPEKIEATLDSVIASNRQKGKELCITHELIAPFLTAGNRGSLYGFGGTEK